MNILEYAGKERDMAEEFNAEGMLDMYLFENGQLLEQLQETVLEQKDADCFDEESINEIFRTMHTIKRRCMRSCVRRGCRRNISALIFLLWHPANGRSYLKVRSARLPCSVFWLQG